MKVKAHKSLGRNTSLLIVVAFIWLLFSILSNGIFISSRNMATFCLQICVLGFFAVGVNVVIILGGIDLSVASVICMLSAVAATLNVNLKWGAVPTLLVMFVCAIAIAAFNGMIVSKLRIPAFVVTLAAQMYLRGLSLTLTKSKEIAPVSKDLRAFATQWLPTQWSIALLLLALFFYLAYSLVANKQAQKNGFISKTTRELVAGWIPVIAASVALLYIALYKGLPIMFLVLVAYAFIVNTFLNHTGYGRSIYAVGANQEAARLSGIKPKKMIFLGFIIMGVSYFLGSWACMARVSGYLPSLGDGMEMDCVASCVIGGTSLMGGVGSTVAALIGVVLYASIDNGMSILNINSFYQYIVKGAILLIAVIINTVKNNKR